ncbi:MAG TPA: PilT/PilU family type 4a pilus ATPase [bacterium]|jgi:twitching motility protein PilT|nr:PilT/PilU family type 4a pilus ATPase [bacterium]
MPSIAAFLEEAVTLHASDIHVGAASRVYARVLGQLRPISEQALSPEEIEPMIGEFLGPEQWARVQQTLEIDTSYTLPSGDRFRLNAFRERNGWNLVARHFSSRIRTIQELGLPEDILRRFADSNQGLILVTGPGRSGKSTTAAALIDHINANREDHIITIEDPIEFLHARKECLVNQRSVGPHTGSFAAALRGALREDPDIILVGEMRDTETMSLALTAAETGHLVIGTLHTQSAAATISRVINLFPAAERAQATASLAEVLVGIISQRLILDATGKAQVPAYEVLVNTMAVASLIHAHEYHKVASVLATGVREGMITLENCLKKMVAAKTITQASMDEILSEGL